MDFSLVPFLFFVQCAAIVAAAYRTQQLGHLPANGMPIVFTQIAALFGWFALTSYWAYSGFYQSDAFLNAWPAFWMFLPPVLIIRGSFFVSPTVKSVVMSILYATPVSYLVSIHALRILAIGSILKALDGEFSYYFAILVGIPDLLFGASALAIAKWAHDGTLTKRTLLIWNIVGAAIIMPYALILIQMGLPGPLQVFTAEPSIATVFEYPMALAPTLVVPLFVMMNILTLASIKERPALA